MRIAQIILSDATEYERKLQRVDFAAFSEKHEVVVGDAGGADVAHVYARVPYASTARRMQSRWWWRKAREPKVVLTDVPEAVEDKYFDVRWQGGGHVIGTYVATGFSPSHARAATSIRNLIEQTRHRLARTRDDVEWRLFERVPAPEDLVGVDVWVDPAIDEKDFDGFVAEALVVGLPVVASRTKMNAARLEHGRTGFLVPLNDANEMTHAILAALFKPEVAGVKQSAGRQTLSKFRAKQRQRVLAQIYESLLT